MAREFRKIKDFAAQVIPRLGKIRLGIKRKSAKSGRPYPSETEYFVFDPDLPERQTIVDLYGERPTKLLVTFASNDIGVIFPQAYKMYGKSLGLVCRGDGEEAERLVIDRTGEGGHPRKRKDEHGNTVTEIVKCPCEFLGGDRPKCRAIGNLLVVLPAVSWQAFQIDTSSYHTMKDIANELHHFATVLHGGIRGKLFWLTREPKDTFGSGSKQVHYTLHLRMPSPEEYAEALESIQKRWSAYDSLIPNALPDAQYHSPVGLPLGSAVEEPDLTADEDLVDDTQLSEGLNGDDLVDADEAQYIEDGGVEQLPRKQGSRDLNQPAEAPPSSPQPDDFDFEF